MGEYSSVAMVNEEASFKCSFAVCSVVVLSLILSVFIYFLIVWLLWDIVQLIT